MTEKKQSYAVGELRPSQVMFTYGVGAIVDLPHFSVMVMGLDDWDVSPDHARELNEERLLAAVQRQLGPQVQRIIAPPATPEDAGMTNPFDPVARIGLPVATFPRWMLCPICQTLAPLNTGIFELKHNPYHPERSHYVHKACQKAGRPPAVVPARFLVACRHGHVDDFPWVEFVHKGPSDCSSLLRLIEYGPSGEARDVEVRCDTCKASRRLADAFGKSGEATMPTCRGRRPHLRDYEESGCNEQVKAILLGASNLWFPEVFTTLALPVRSTARLDTLVDELWATLKNLQSLQNVELLRTLGQLADFQGYANQEIWEGIQRRRAAGEEGDAIADPMDLKTPEWEMFIRPEQAPASEDFRMRSVAVPPAFQDVLEQVVLAERLREVRALVGFTRVEAPGAWGEVSDPEERRRMVMSRRTPLWTPGSEVRGEGIFLQFRESAIREWLAQERLIPREEEFVDSHTRWRKARFIPHPEQHFPGLRYVLLHSFAHALMRRLVLACGYNAASVRERIYSRNPGEDELHPEPMAGLLVYTAAPDSEGTLGGLVSLGEPDQFQYHIQGALEDALLCASDPLCAEHPPSRRGLTLHAAACHACLFAPETSCENGNRYLDRSVLIPTVKQEAYAFFGRVADGFGG